MKKSILIFSAIMICIGGLIAQQDTLYIYKSGLVVYQRAVADIDSMTFVPGTNPIPNCGTVTDADGNVYGTVIIGTQCWMASNLKTTKLNDNTPIQNVTTGWDTLTNMAYCWYDNLPANGNTYGALYNWFAVETGKLCPTGWHVPTDAEWTVLSDYLGGANIAGGKLKETGTSHWNHPNSGATNETGFTALPGGNRNQAGDFVLIGDDGRWWSSTEHPSFTSSAWYRNATYSSAQLYRSNLLKIQGYSIRCVKD